MQTGRRSWLFLAALSIGLGTISDIWMLAIVVPYGIVVLVRRWRDLLWNLPLVAVPFGLYIFSLFNSAPQALLMDLQFVLFRVSNVSLAGQIQNIATNYTVLLSQDFWMPAAVIGFFMLRPAALCNLTMLLFFASLAILGRTIALYNLSAYYMIPLLPFIAFSAAILMYTGLPYIWRQLIETLNPAGPIGSLLISAAICLFVAGSPILVSLWLDVDHVHSGFPTSIDPFLTSPDEARQVAQFINTNAQPDDLVHCYACRCLVAQHAHSRLSDVHCSHRPGNGPLPAQYSSRSVGV
jgi:hypothetical protein